MWKVSRTNEAVILKTELKKDGSFQSCLRNFLDSYNGDINFYCDRQVYNLLKLKIMWFHHKDSSINFKRGYKNCLEELQQDSDDNFDGRIKFIIPDLVKAFSQKKSDRSIDGSSYKTYLNGRPASLSEANGARDCTSKRSIVEIVNRELKRNNLIEGTWDHSKIQSQVRS